MLTPLRIGAMVARGKPRRASKVQDMESNVHQGSPTTPLFVKPRLWVRVYFLHRIYLHIN